VSYDISKFPKNIQDKLNNITQEEAVSTGGILGDNLIEPVPNYRKAPNEVILAEGQPKNNQWIVMGRDRNAGLNSGYGSMGHTGAGAIDIVVGRSFNGKPMKDEAGDDNYVDNDFEKDAARIYISQKADIDEYFSIKSATGVRRSTGKSAIGIKADAVRVIAREGIKLVTATDKNNSLGGKITRINGIDLIAGNIKYGLQPMVKGNNLVHCLQEIQAHIGELANAIDSLAQKQLALDATLAAHTHITASPAGPGVAAPSVELAAAAAADAAQLGIMDIPMHLAVIMNMTFTDADYLTAGGSKYILSRFNKTN
tara:strand:+ start:3306 stop:4241 length:936 start_codon:yes stop_codon:yes gene_type:complete